MSHVAIVGLVVLYVPPAILIGLRCLRARR